MSELTVVLQQKVGYDVDMEKHLIIWFCLAWLAWLPIASAGSGERLATRLLQVAEQTEDAAALRQLAEAFARSLPKSEQAPCALILKAVDGGYWQDVLPRASANTRAFGVPFVYALEEDASPLAALARDVIAELSSSTVHSRLAMAEALHQTYPDEEIFRYLQAGIEAALAENERYALTAVRGDQLASRLQPQVDAVREELQAPGLMRTERQRLEARLQELEDKLQEGAALIQEGRQYRPLSESLTDLRQALLLTVDELEVIGDL